MHVVPRLRALSAAGALSVLGLLGAHALRSAQAEERVGTPPPRTTEEALVELGRRLFFEPLASRSGARSCASCHDPEHGYSDPAVRSDDDVARTRRHSQTLLDSHLNPSAHWDGEFDSIEELVAARLGAIQGVRGRLAHGAVLEGAAPSRSAGGGGYGSQPTPAPPPEAPPEGGRNPARNAEPDDPDAPPSGDDPVTTPGGEDAAETQGEQDDEKPDARTDRKARREKPTSDARVLPLDLTKLPLVADQVEEAGRYAEAFQAAFGSRSVTTARISEAIAAYCRSIRSTESAFDRYRQGQREALSPSARRGLDLFQGRAGCAQCHLTSGAAAPLTDFAFHNTGVTWTGLQRGLAPGREAVDADERASADGGRELITHGSTHRRAFKTPTLRDVTRRGPYMHDGSFGSLADVVRYYAAGGSKDERQDARVRGFKASEQDVADLVAFLESLTGDEVPGRAPRAWHRRAEVQRVQLLDAQRRPLVGMTVTLVPEGDLLPVAGAERSAPVTLASDAQGWIRFAPSSRTHVRLDLGEGLVPVGGALVPDSCTQATVQVPVAGRVTLVVAFEAGAPAPPRLVAEHELTMRLPGHVPPRTVLVRDGVRELGDRVVASYQGWLRTDVPSEVIVRIPGDGRARAEHRLTLTDERTLKLDLGP